MKGDGRVRRNRTGGLLLLAIIFAGLCSGCGMEGAVTEETERDRRAAAVVKEATEDINQVHLRDKETLYENDDEDSVVTMYLTVSSGNSSENTDHSWEEINSYSAYDYEDMGVERYQVNGLLQVGDENGPVVGEVGYGESVPNATVQIRGRTRWAGMHRKTIKSS